MRPNQRGQVSAFVVGIVAALVLLAGLVYDGGEILAAKQRAIDEAQSAARAGAQAISITTYRSAGAVALDPAGAAGAAQSFLARTGDTGDAVIRGDVVTVRVRVRQGLAILRLGGLGTVTVTGVGTARAVRGVTAGEP